MTDLETHLTHIDDEPTANSENLVKSGGVQKVIANSAIIEGANIPFKKGISYAGAKLSDHIYYIEDADAILVELPINNISTITFNGVLASACLYKGHIPSYEKYAINSNFDLSLINVPYETSKVSDFKPDMICFVIKPGQIEDIDTIEDLVDIVPLSSDTVRNISKAVVYSPMVVYTVGDVIYNAPNVTFKAGATLGYKLRNKSANQTISFAEDTTYTFPATLKKLVIRENNVVFVDTQQIQPTDILLLQYFGNDFVGGELYPDYLKRNYSTPDVIPSDDSKNYVYSGTLKTLFDSILKDAKSMDVSVIKSKYITIDGGVASYSGAFYADLFVPEGVTILACVGGGNTNALLSRYDYQQGERTNIVSGGTTRWINYAAEEDSIITISGHQNSFSGKIYIIRERNSVFRPVLNLNYYVNANNKNLMKFDNAFYSEDILLNDSQISAEVSAGSSAAIISRVTNGSYTPLVIGDADHTLGRKVYASTNLETIVLSGDFVPNQSPTNIEIIPVTKQFTDKSFSLTQGCISIQTGLYPTISSYINGNYSHTPRYIKLPKGEISIISPDNIVGYILFYDDEQRYITYNSINESTKHYNRPDASYFRIVAYDTNNPSNPAASKVIINGNWESTSEPLESFEPRSLDDGYQNIGFPVNISLNNAKKNEGPSLLPITVRSVNYGVLHLPDSYAPTGSPTPLIIYLHGAAERYTINSKRFGDNVRYSPEWSAAGYAQMDVDMIPDLYNYSDTGSCGVNDDAACVEAAYQWVIEHYNIDRNGVYLFGRSRGGQAVLSILGRYNPSKLPIICALSNAGANEILLYGLIYPMSPMWWTVFCNSMGLPLDSRPVLSSRKAVLTDSSIVEYLRNNIDIWWNKAKVAMSLIVENNSEYKTPLEIFDLYVDAVNNVDGKRVAWDNFLRTCKFKSPVPLRFDWCVGDTIQKFNSFPRSWYNGFGVSVMHGFIDNNINGNAVYREWSGVPEGNEAHFHEKFNLVSEYTLHNGVTVENASIAQIEWLLWAQSFDQRRLSGVYRN